MYEPTVWAWSWIGIVQIVVDDKTVGYTCIIYISTSKSFHTQEVFPYDLLVLLGVCVCPYLAIVFIITTNKNSLFQVAVMSESVLRCVYVLPLFVVELDSLF